MSTNEQKRSEFRELIREMPWTLTAILCLVLGVLFGTKMVSNWTGIPLDSFVPIAVVILLAGVAALAYWNGGKQ